MTRGRGELDTRSIRDASSNAASRRLTDAAAAGRCWRSYPRTARGFPRASGRAPRRIACWSRGAMRAAPGGKVTYAQMLARVRRVAAGLLDAKPFGGTTHRHPVGQQHRASDARAGGDVGRHSLLPRVACLLARWLAISRKFRYVMDLLTPGLVAAFDTPRFDARVDVRSCRCRRSSAMRRWTGARRTRWNRWNAKPQSASPRRMRPRMKTRS